MRTASEIGTQKIQLQIFISSSRVLQGHSDQGHFASLLGVATDDPNNFMKTKGNEMGREIMSKLMQAVYQEDGMEPPADAVGALCACSVTFAARRASSLPWQLLNVSLAWQLFNVRCNRSLIMFACH